MDWQALTKKSVVHMMHRHRTWYLRCFPDDLIVFHLYHGAEKEKWEWFMIGVSLVKPMLSDIKRKCAP